MVESEADGLNEEVMLGAVTCSATSRCRSAIKAINELVAESGKPKWDLGRARSRTPN